MRIGKYEFKEDLIYSEEHLWISIKENIARIGIDSFLVDKLKEIINIEFLNDVLQCLCGVHLYCKAYSS